MTEQYVGFGRVCPESSSEEQTKPMSCCLTPMLLEEEGIREKHQWNMQLPTNSFPEQSISNTESNSIEYWSVSNNLCKTFSLRMNICLN